MPPEESFWTLLSRRAFKLFKSHEVKTPLSFVFRALTVYGIILGIVLYSPIKDELKWNIVLLSFLVVCLLTAFVGMFTWYRPKNLVYGESGHRAEYKLEFGTERHIVTEGQLEELTPIEDKKNLLLE